MNKPEEKSLTPKQNKVPMANPCYYCLCNSCINNAESRTVTPKELPNNWNPCFFCDICSNYDEKEIKNMEKDECMNYRIDDYHVIKNRKKMKIVR